MSRLNNYKRHVYRGNKKTKRPETVFQLQLSYSPGKQSKLLPDGDFLKDCMVEAACSHCVQTTKVSLKTSQFTIIKGLICENKN